MSLNLSKLMDDAKTGNQKALRILSYHYLEEALSPYPSLYALEWIKKAAHHGERESQYILGVMYLNGLGRNKSESIAQEWFGKARANGQTEPPKKLAEFNQENGLSLVFPQFASSAADDEGAEVKKSELTFADVAFKKSENGKMIVNLMTVEDRNDEDRADDDDSEYRLDEPEYKYDEGQDAHYAPSPLKIHQINTANTPEEELETLIGLSSIKAQIKQVQSRLRFENKRKEAGMKAYMTGNHFVFNGAPGTGKTTVARLLGHILYNEGVLSKGHVVEVDRGDLIGEYVGKTAIKTKKAIDAAKGGILFIDEAYALNDGYELDFGHEALATLVKAMEDERGNFVVVMAGYAEEMSWLVKSNPGLQSRIRHHITFDNFSHDELMAIFEKQCDENGYELDAGARSLLSDTIKEGLKKDIAKLGNARFVRNIFEKSLEKMALRVVQNNLESEKDLKTILFMDIPSFEEVSGVTLKQRAKSTGDVVQF